MTTTERKPAVKDDDFLTTVARSIGSTLGAVVAKVDEATRPSRPRRSAGRKRARKHASVSRASFACFIRFSFEATQRSGAPYPKESKEVFQVANAYQGRIHMCDSSHFMFRYSHCSPSVPSQDVRPTKAKSPDVSDSIRRSLDQAGLKDVKVQSGQDERRSNSGWRSAVRHG